MRPTRDRRRRSSPEVSAAKRFAAIDPDFFDFTRPDPSRLDLMWSPRAALADNVSPLTLSGDPTGARGVEPQLGGARSAQVIEVCTVPGPTCTLVLADTPTPVRSNGRGRAIRRPPPTVPMRARRIVEVLHQCCGPA
jgi:hypothetical protein